jgi:eukaryotic-like serine/threonine-protein kinase
MLVSARGGMSLVQSEVDDDALSVGQTLSDKWQIVRLIGRGGMSAVYEAEDRTGNSVAIKVLNGAFARQTRARERFLREGLVANRVGHPDTVHVLDSQQTPEGRLLLVMELLHGQTLRRRCEAAGGRLELQEVLPIADQVLAVLAAAHAQGIFHRDIKPDNIFLTTDCCVKVLDFGVAAVRDEASQDASITQSGTTLGTPAFMAPEQARGRQAQVDGRTDIWALGATLFFCLTGRRVHEGAVTANEALIFAATQRAPAISRFCPELANDVGKVIDRALAFAPRERWPSADAMRAGLALAASRQADASTSPLGTPQDDTLASTFAEANDQNHRWLRWPLIAALAVTVLLVSLATAFRPHQRSNAPEPPVATNTRVKALHPPPVHAGLAPKATKEATSAPVASVRRAPASGRQSTASARARVGTSPHKSSGLREDDDVPDTLLDRRK